MNNALQLNEIFDDVAKQPTRESRRDRFLQYLKTDKSILPYVHMAFVPSAQLAGLPEGYPHGPNGRKLIDKDVPEGMGYTTLRVEVRRFQNFAKTGSAQKLTAKKREFLWARQIEGLQWKEAELITAIKDGALLTKYPFFLEVQDLAGVEIKDSALGVL